MATGNKFLLADSKRLIDQHDLSTRVVAYIQGLARDVLKRAFANGVFGEDSSVTVDMSFGLNTITLVNANGVAHDGDGHIIDMGQIASEYKTSVPFPNVNAATYYVGLAYSEHPSGVRINPRTGSPEFVEWVEDVGEEGEPSSVTNNGNGTITFNVNSLADAGASIAGRKVRVWKKVPGPSATSESVAIEVLTVSWNGSENRITTAAAFGQSTVSTTPSDYRVQLIGPSIKAENLSVSERHFYIGAVVGNGAVPSSYNLSGQRLLRPLNAPTMGMSPYGWIGSDDVQSAFQEIVDDLSAQGASAGATLIGNNFTRFAPRLVTPIGGGGIGNISDGTFSAASRVDDALDGIDEILRRRRGFTALLQAQVGAERVGDFNGAGAFDSVQSAFPAGGLFVVASADDSWYTIGSAGFTSYHRYVGERSNFLQLENGTKFRIDSTAVAPVPLIGSFENFYMWSSSNNSHYRAKEGFDLKRCAIESGTMSIYVDIGGDDVPFSMRECEVFPWTGNASQLPCAVRVEWINSAKGAFGVIENCVIEGPDDETVGAQATFYVQSNGGSTFGALNDRPLTMRNCVIKCAHVEANVVKIRSCASPIVFEDCVFIGAEEQTVPLIDCQDANVTFVRCVFDAKEGQCAKIVNCHGKMEDCEFYTGVGSEVANPQILGVRGAPGRGFDVVRCQVWVDHGAIRDHVGNTAVKPLIELGAVDGDATQISQLTNVDGLVITYASNTGGLHARSTLRLVGQPTASGGAPCRYANITLNLNSRYVVNALGGIDSPAIVEAARTALERKTIENLSIINCNDPESANSVATRGNTESSIFHVIGAVVKNVLVRKDATLGFDWGHHVRIGEQVEFDGLTLEGNFKPPASTGSAVEANGGRSRLSNLKFALVPTANVVGRYVYLAGGPGAAGFDLDGIEFDASSWGAFTVSQLIEVAAEDASVRRVRSRVNLGARRLVLSSGARLLVQGCNCQFTGSQQVVNATGNHTLISGNVFVSSDATVTISNAGTGAVTGDDNILA